MKRILAVGHGQDGSGFARVLRGILSGLCHDFDIHHIGLNGFGAGAPGDWIRHPCRDPNDAYGFDELRLQMGALRPDVVFVLHDLWILPGYLDAMQGFKAPVVAYTPIDGQLARAESVYALRELRCLVTYLPSAREQMRQAFEELAESDGIAMPELHAIPHGIDLDSFCPVENAREKLFPSWKEAGDAFLFLNANRNWPRKQLILTIEAFARFAQGKPESVKLYLHSAPQGCVDLRAAAERYGIGPRLLLTEDCGMEHPVVSEERLNWIYNACDAGVNTSCGEGWGLVSFEHGSTGAPQIVPRHSACADLWHGSAEMVDAELEPKSWQSPLRMSRVSVKGVTQAMERIYEDGALRSDLSRAARVNATSPAFGWPVVVEQWHGLFDRVTTEGNL